MAFDISGLTLDISRLTDDDVVDRRTAARIVGLRPSTLATWACTGAGNLPYIRAGRRAVYRVGTLRQWLRDRTITHTGELEARS